MFKKNQKRKKAFTLIELLVVIAIIGILATLAVVALQNARQNARDAKRIADVRQMQTALALYYSAYGEYPTSTGSQPAHEALIGIGVGGLGDFIVPVPQAPSPADGDCELTENTYMYEQTEGGDSYLLQYCLGKESSGLSSGLSYASPAYLQVAVESTPSCPEGEELCGGACCANVCCEGVCCEVGMMVICDNGVCFDACFSPDSLISMSDGSTKKISEIKLGDKVLSYDRDNKKITEEIVTHIFDNSVEQMGDHYLEINLENGEKIEVTPSHPFAHPNMDEEGLKRAKDLRPGDYLMSKDLNYIKIGSIYKVFKSIKTYNLEISNTHTFIVDGIIVGNMTFIRGAEAAGDDDPPPAPLKPQ
jgi:prepilin-type N-terminal cleavage/methylation domain-containing protein